MSSSVIYDGWFLQNHSISVNMDKKKGKTLSEQETGTEMVRIFNVKKYEVK